MKKMSSLYLLCNICSISITKQNKVLVLFILITSMLLKYFFSPKQEVLSIYKIVGWHLLFIKFKCRKRMSSFLFIFSLPISASLPTFKALWCLLGALWAILLLWLPPSSLIWSMGAVIQYDFLLLPRELVLRV